MGSLAKMSKKRYRGGILKLFNKKNIISLAVILAVYFIVQFFISNGSINDYIFTNVVLIGINIILALGLNLITGFTGQFSLGHAGFMSIGAYICAIVTAKLGLPFAIGIILAAISAAVIGFLIGLPTLRLKGDYLAIATLGFGEIIKNIFFNIDYVGGASGFNDIPFYTNWTWLYFSVVLTVVVVNNFIKSYAGRACIAIREDETAAEAMGVNTTNYKILAFVIGAFFAGIAGALYANYICLLKPDSFGFLKSIDILVIVVFGGMGSITGSIFGAIALTVISAFLQSFPELRMVIYSLILFFIMIYRPQGLMGTKEFSLGFLKKRGGLNAKAQDK